MAGLHNVIKAGRYRQFVLLMKLGIDANYPAPEDGLVPLTRCCYLENDRLAALMTKALLDHGAEKSATDRTHRNCLVHAVITDRINIMRLLLDMIDFDVNQCDDFGNTLLHHVAFNSGVEMTRLVVSRLPLNRTNVDKVNKDTMTPLMCACANGNLAAAQVLVNEANASLTVRDSPCFRNALDWLRSSTFVPKNVNPFSYSYKQEKTFLDIDSPALKWNWPISLAVERSKTSLTPTLGDVNKYLTPVIRSRTLSAPAQKDKPGSCVRRLGNVTSPSVDDLSDMRSAESRIRLLRDKNRYNNMQLLRQMFMKYETQLCPAYRPPAAFPTCVTVEDTESEVSYSSSSQTSCDRESQGSGQIKKVESTVESALLFKRKLSRNQSRVQSRASNISRFGKQYSSDSSANLSSSLSSSASSEKARERMRKTQSKLAAKRSLSQPVILGDGDEDGNCDKTVTNS